MVPKPPRTPAPDTLHNIVTRGFMAVLGLGALVVVADPGSVKSYENEVEYAKANGKLLMGRAPHRCNDRVEDFVQAIAGEEGSIFRDAWPTVKLLGRCMLSSKGQEPADPYQVLGAWNPCWIDPELRARQREKAAWGSSSSSA
ncbi:hypothetical protein FOA52_007724 [Chlamydomonas sp. UWO 241]|nr:hypothetical protein FOA52_007724 [Chlamydomonas sp. UWO 241]